MEKEDSLKQEIKRLNESIIKVYKRQSFSRAFLSGILVGLGSAVGATIVFGLLVYLFGNVRFVPIIGDWFTAVANHVIDNLPQ